MNQDRVITEFTSLERKLNLLLGEFKNLKEELSILRNGNSELKDIIKTKDEQLSNFQNKNNISKIVNTISVEEDNTELKKSIDNYIREIDKCIAYLSE
jgi:hypothetical protein